MLGNVKMIATYNVKVSMLEYPDEKVTFKENITLNIQREIFK